MSVKIRDNLLVTAGVRAGCMDMMNVIELPSGVEGEDEVAEFIADAIDDWICFHSDINFDEYIETELLNKYRTKTIFHLYEELSQNGTTNDCK